MLSSSVSVITICKGATIGQYRQHKIRFLDFATGISLIYRFNCIFFTNEIFRTLCTGNNSGGVG